VPYVPSHAVECALPMSITLWTATAETRDAIRRLSRWDRMALIHGSETLREHLGFEPTDMTKSVPMCSAKKCLNRWTHDEIREHFYDESWLLGAPDKADPTKITNVSASIKTVRSGSLLHLLPLLCRKCDCCDRYNSYSFYATQYQAAGGSIEELQKKMLNVLVGLLPSAGWSVSHCPSALCRFSQSGVMHRSTEVTMRCPGCNITTCTRCHERVESLRPGQRHLCAVGPEIELQIARWAAQRCVSCGNVGEKRDVRECDHMTCRCGAHFCYNCGRDFPGGHGIYQHIYVCRDSREDFMRRHHGGETLVELYKIWLALRANAHDDEPDYDMA
jgi:hypothetical protein